jgi:hypothetical protein
VRRRSVAVLALAVILPFAAASSGSPAAHRVSGAREAAEGVATAAAVVWGTAGDDRVVLQGSAEGTMTVVVNGQAQSLGPGRPAGVVVESFGGDDEVSTEATLTVPVTVYAGGGDDEVELADAADLYVDGGPGADRLTARTGPAQLFGGPGDDVLDGTAGTMAGGPGADTFSGGAATRVFLQAGERVDGPVRLTYVSPTRDAAGLTPGAGLRILGDDAFRRRVGADVNALLSLPEGRLLLAGLDDAHRAVTVSESAEANSTRVDRPGKAYLRAGGSHGSGSSSRVSYDPYVAQLGDGLQPWQNRPPVIGLVHELIHALNASTGTLQKGLDDDGVLKLESQAVGLPFDGVKFRWTPSSPSGSDNPRAFTENTFRALLALPSRSSY